MSTKRKTRRATLKLNEKQQRAILKNLSPKQLKEIDMEVSMALQEGLGIGDMVKFFRNILGPIGKSIGTNVIKAFISLLPSFKKGKGLALAGQGVKAKGGRLNLSLPQQRALIKALSPEMKRKVIKRVRTGEQNGEGILDIIGAVAKVLGPIALEVGPKVIKEIVIPLIGKVFKKRKAKPKKKPSPKTKFRTLADFRKAQREGRIGKGLKLAGQGRKRTRGRKKKRGTI